VRHLRDAGPVSVHHEELRGPPALWVALGAGADERDPLPVRRPRRLALVSRQRDQATHVAVPQYVEVEVAAATAGEDDLFPVRRPGWVDVVELVVREVVGAASASMYDVKLGCSEVRRPVADEHDRATKLLG
jgi:hypothetical protein